MKRPIEDECGKYSCQSKYLYKLEAFGDKDLEEANNLLIKLKNGTFYIGEVRQGEIVYCDFQEYIIIPEEEIDLIGILN